MKSRYGVLLLLSLALLPRASAQNVTGYDVMEDPLLFLLREPAIHRDLGLSKTQTDRLIEVNESLDSIMLSNRNNKNASEVQRNNRQVNEKSRAAVTSILSTQQQQRLRQIGYRLKGISFVLLPDAAKKLELTSQQKETIQSIVTEAAEKISKVSSRAYQGEEAHREANKTMAAARKREQSEIIAALDNKQKQQIAALVGKNFDPTSLGQASFRAPNLVDSGDWVNTEPLRLADLRGKVVALHFYAYG